MCIYKVQNIFNTCWKCLNALFQKKNEALWRTSACKLQKQGSRRKSVFVVMWVLYGVIVDSLCAREKYVHLKKQNSNSTVTCSRFCLTENGRNESNVAISHSVFHRSDNIPLFSSLFHSEFSPEFSHGQLKLCGKQHTSLFTALNKITLSLLANKCFVGRSTLVIEKAHVCCKTVTRGGTKIWLAISQLTWSLPFVTSQHSQRF